MPDYINYNGKIVEEANAFISPSNRSFRYGDGCFETMKMINNKIILQDLHLERLFASLDQLQFDIPKHFTPTFIIGNIDETAKKNKHADCRVRLTIFRGDGGLYDPENLLPNFIIQTYPLDVVKTINENGLIVDFFKDTIKAADQYSSIKSNNFLSYAMAALWVKKQKLNDALLLNQFNRIADATIANIFIVENGVIKTPSLAEGPVAGVMRKHLLASLRKDDMPVHETEITIDEVLNASEVFLTNAIHGIKWVKQAGTSNYSGDFASHLYKKYVLPLLTT
jgi:branched-subunit amino acid aminotransferase/4-amino-4-deoxychorismate lyase